MILFSLSFHNKLLCRNLMYAQLLTVRKMHHTSDDSRLDAVFSNFFSNTDLFSKNRNIQLGFQEQDVEKILKNLYLLKIFNSDVFVSCFLFISEVLLFQKVFFPNSVQKNRSLRLVEDRLNYIIPNECLCLKNSEYRPIYKYWCVCFQQKKILYLYLFILLWMIVSYNTIYFTPKKGTWVSVKLCSNFLKILMIT